MNNIKSILTIILCLSGLFSKAQQPWTLQDCILFAREHNLTFKKKQLDVRSNEIDYHQAKMELLPDINVSGRQNYNLGRTLDPFTNDFITEQTSSTNLGVASNVTLFKGLQRWNTIKMYRYRLQAQQEDAAFEWIQLQNNIIHFFFQVLYYQDLLDVYTNSQRVSEKQYEKTRILAEQGMLSKTDVLTMNVQVRNDQFRVTSTRNKLQTLYLELFQHMNLDSTEGFMLNRNEIIMLEEIEDLESYLNKALQNNPEAKKASISTLAAERQLAVERGKRWPSVSLGAAYSTGYSSARNRITGVTQTEKVVGYTPDGEQVVSPSFTYTYGAYPFRDQLIDNTYKTIGIGISIPVFNNWYNNSTISKASIEVKKARYEEEHVINQLVFEVRKLHAEVMSAFEEYQALEENVKAKQEAVKHARTLFELGRMSAVDYNLSHNELLLAEANLLYVKYLFITNLKALELVVCE